ncbi:TetR/AcrR family transcriptional regulator [Streptomyces turgidiscabies]|uniref:Transcriptional regulator, TetR family n=1 Tax=Streptomyces turgidiscabies (strain Car8) TaxID=698760 RepID=L7FH55_STRT8|nr:MULTISPECIES: TetR/AcrR family transcriptional regulator [Streptomyces]ELP70642.1 transcriptional regulator, TetR family [Streptomyces turgidiscabies Car8]MDX3497149.1 TetR/AcrR family transcriptional regulator [Streptomyces turgidiscabies]GAQ68702.1 HTH-type transcriptional regulator AcrR [Streptomyces turgidiscabies]
MTASEEGRSARKHTAIMAAATQAFMNKGYAGTSMDDIARLAAVSKQTVYKHFTDKEKLFAEIVLATTDRVDDMVALVADIPADVQALDDNLTRLARQFLTALTQPEVLQLRRLIIANADTFPQLGAAWYEQGFERVLATLAATFQRLADHGLLRTADPHLAANHFSGLLLWIPVNKAMFTGSPQHTQDELDHYAAAGVRAFLAAYR